MKYSIPPSTTVTVKDVFEVPTLLVEEQVTVVTPSTKIAPEAAVHDTGSVALILSEAVGVAYVTTTPVEEVAEAERLDGVPLIIGRVILTPPPPTNCPGV